MKMLIGVVVILGLIGAGVWGWRALAPTLESNPAIEKIKQSGTIVVGTDATYPPLESRSKQGEIVGFDIDLAKEVAQKLGVKLEVKNVAFDDIFGELEQGKIDLIASSVTITPERSAKYAFSVPYFNAGQVIVARAEGEIKSSGDLRGRAIGAQTDTTSLTEAKKLTDPKQVKGYANYELATKDLLAKKIAAIVIDYPAGVGLTQENSQLKVIGEPFTQEFYGMVATKDQAGLLLAVNQTLVELKESGKMETIRRAWGL